MRDRWEYEQRTFSLYKADKQERLNKLKVNTPDYRAMRGRDLERRKRVMKIFTANELHT
jgi:hypothetical protein